MNKFKRGLEYIGDAWWLFIIEGLATILFGAFMLFYPGMTINLLAIVAAMYCLIIGMLGLVHGLSGIGHKGSWWISAIFGIIVFGAGGYLLFNPKIQSMTLDALAGTLVIVRGAFALIVAFVFTKMISLRRLWAIAGALGVIAGVIVWITPSNTGIAFDKALGLYLMVIAGPISIGYALRVKDMPQS